MTLFDLMFAFALTLVAIVIWQNAGFRDRALLMAQRYCERRDVQLLDETIAFRGMGLGRDNRGNWGIRRTFEFEFTATGERRYRGQLVMLGARLVDAELQAHQIH